MEPEKGHGWKRKNIYKIPIVGFHVNICPGCIWLVVNVFRLRCTQAEFARSEHPYYHTTTTQIQQGQETRLPMSCNHHNHHFQGASVRFGDCGFLFNIVRYTTLPPFFAGENRNSLPCCGVDWVMVIQPLDI